MRFNPRRWPGVPLWRWCMHDAYISSPISTSAAVAVAISVSVVVSVAVAVAVAVAIPFGTGPPACRLLSALLGWETSSFLLDPPLGWETSS